jgi:hypothetical protein
MMVSRGSPSLDYFSVRLFQNVPEFKQFTHDEVSRPYVVMLFECAASGCI